jgi:hypothetical protein
MIRLIRRIVSGLVVLFSLFPLWVAFGFFRLGVETWFGHPYYLGNDHLQRGCFWLLVGLAALLPGSYCVVSRRASAWWLALGFAAALFAAVVLPSNVLPTMLIPRAEDTLTARARTIANALDTLGANQGRFPANEAELAQVAAKLQGPDALVGPYYRDGTVAPVRLVYVGAASGPVLAEPDAPMPAAIYCAVSADRQRFWITVAMSDREVGGHPRWLRGTDGGTQPMVIRGSVRDGLPRMSKIGGVDSPQ